MPKAKQAQLKVKFDKETGHWTATDVDHPKPEAWVPASEVLSARAQGYNEAVEHNNRDSLRMFALYMKAAWGTEPAESVLLHAMEILNAYKRRLDNEEANQLKE